MKKGERRGFTIIEVTLVLAIAGLIFLMVFVTLPQVMRNERDTERREDASALLSAIKKYQSNNRGALPNGWTQFRDDYLGDDFVDPSTGVKYTLFVETCGNSTGKACFSTSNPDIGTIMVATGATCNNNNVAVGASNPRKVAVMIKLEAGNTVYCDNS